MQQEGVGYHNTFSPVINWSTDRSIIIMAEMDGLESRKNDYVRDLSQSTNL